MKTMYQSPEIKLFGLQAVDVILASYTGQNEDKGGTQGDFFSFGGGFSE